MFIALGLLSFGLCTKNPPSLKSSFEAKPFATTLVIYFLIVTKLTSSPSEFSFTRISSSGLRVAITNSIRSIP